MLSVCRLIMGARQQQAQHNQTRRKRHHYSQKKPVIRFHSHTTQPCLPPWSLLSIRAPQISQSIERRVHQLVYSTKKNKRSKTGPRNTAGVGDMFPLRKRCLIALRFDVAILPAISYFTSRHCDWCDWSTSDGDDIERESGRSAGHSRHRQSSGEILGPSHAARDLCAP